MRGGLGRWVGWHLTHKDVSAQVNGRSPMIKSSSPSCRYSQAHAHTEARCRAGTFPFSGASERVGKMGEKGVLWRGDCFNSV